jgi:hypothetical protein
MDSGSTVTVVLGGLGLAWLGLAYSACTGWHVLVCRQGCSKVVNSKFTVLQRIEWRTGAAR